MLSDLLTSYQGHFADWAKSGGIHMDARLCALLSTNLADAAQQARTLEGAPVPPAAMPLPAGVVRLDDFRPAMVAAVQSGVGDGGQAA